MQHRLLGGPPTLAAGVGVCRGRRTSRVAHRVAQAAAAQDADGGGGEIEKQPPKALRRVALKRPLGLTLGERARGGDVFVESVLPGGNAEKAGVRTGATLAACSAVVLKDGESGERPGYGGTPWLNYERVRFLCRGQSFDSVMGAIGSNDPRKGYLDVVLELEEES